MSSTHHQDDELLQQNRDQISAFTQHTQEHSERLRLEPISLYEQLRRVDRHMDEASRADDFEVPSRPPNASPSMQCSSLDNSSVGRASSIELPAPPVAGVDELQDQLLRRTPPRQIAFQQRQPASNPGRKRQWDEVDSAEHRRFALGDDEGRLTPVRASPDLEGEDLPSDPLASSPHLRFDPDGCSQPRNKYGYVDFDPDAEAAFHARELSPARPNSTDQIKHETSPAQSDSVGQIKRETSPSGPQLYSPLLPGSMRPPPGNQEQWSEWQQEQQSSAQQPSRRPPSSDPPIVHRGDAEMNFEPPELDPIDIPMEEFLRMCDERRGSDLISHLATFVEHGWSPSNLHLVTKEDEEAMMVEIPWSDLDTLLAYHAGFEDARERARWTR